MGKNIEKAKVEIYYDNIQEKANKVLAILEGMSICEAKEILELAQSLLDYSIVGSLSQRNKIENRLMDIIDDALEK
jgi:predicted trehalose synthase